METELFTWESLRTISGSALVVFLLVQYTKDPIDKYLKLPTDIYTVMVSFVVIMLVNMSGEMDYSDWRIYVLSFFNSFLIAASASHVYQKAAKHPTLKSREKE